MEIRRTTQFLSFALGTRSPQNPDIAKPKHYNDPNDAKLKFPKGKVPYYDPVTKKVKVPGKDTAQSKSKRRSSVSKKKPNKEKAIKDDEEEEEDDELIKPKPVENDD